MSRPGLLTDTEPSKEPGGAPGGELDRTAEIARRRLRTRNKKESRYPDAQFRRTVFPTSPNGFRLALSLEPTVLMWVAGPSAFARCLPPRWDERVLDVCQCRAFGKSCLVGALTTKPTWGWRSSPSRG